MTPPVTWRLEKADCGPHPLTYLLTSPAEQQAAVMSRQEERLTAGEMEMVMSTFKQYEVSLRGACIDVKDLLPALVSLGLNMMEQEVIRGNILYKIPTNTKLSF